MGDDPPDQDWYFVVEGFRTSTAARCAPDKSFQPTSSSSLRSPTAAARRFERLRIPLAKQEPARRYEDTDWALAFPTLVQGHGVAWRVSGDTVISRRGLADGFLDVLKSIRTGGT
jgi:hypothetical protein